MRIRKRWLVTGVSVLIISALWMVVGTADWARGDRSGVVALASWPDRHVPVALPAAPTATVTIYLPLMVRNLVTALPEAIAFEAQRDGNYEVYLMNPDGSFQTNLTRHPAKDVAPDWSPDGRRIAFVSDRDGNAEIYVMERDGTGAVRLTFHPANDGWPTWSPDGTRIAFQSNRDDPNGERYDIYVMSADGSGQIRLTSHAGEDRWPDWSPDGAKIAYTSNRIYKKILIMNPDGSNQDMVSDPGGYYDDLYPTWSPDGRITFVSNRPAFTDGTRDDEIYLMRADGSDVEQLTDNKDHGDWLARWSADGTQFAFYTNRDGNKNIYRKVLATVQELRLTEHPTDDEYPNWSP